jgi:hypothetical protein
MDGIQPVIVGLICATIISMGINIFFPNGNILNTLKTIIFWKSVFIFTMTLIMLMKKMHPIKTILM